MIHFPPPQLVVMTMWTQPRPPTLEAVARSRSAAVFALEKMALLSSFAKRKNGFCATFEKNFVMNFVKFGSTP